MRNLKRALSLTLASVMLLGMMIVGTSAVSFNDADDITNVTAATILQEIGVMVGDGENFMPDQIVTRGQMAIIVCKLLYGDKLNVSQFEGSTQYTDVKVGDYFNGYVNLATSLGIISGYGNGQFGPGDPVTTAQAALMLTKALGYYQNKELSGDWSQDALAAITQATRLTMFEGIKAPAANEGLTRDNVAVMSFNTLTRATPVRFNSILNEYYTVGGSVSTGVEYIDAYEFGKRGDAEYAHTLGYTIYGLHISNFNDTDDFNRPADEWSYEKGGIIGSFNNEPIATFSSKVTSKTLYSTIGKTAVDGYENWNVSINGTPVNYTAAMLNSNKADDNNDFYKEAGGAKVTTNGNAVDALTGNGVITEVYVDGADRRVDVVVIDQYAAEVYKVSEGMIRLSDLVAGPAKITDEFAATGYAEDDVVIYTYADKKIQTVAPAERVDGEVTRVRANTSDSDGDNFNIDSTTYNYNRNMTKDRLTTENVDNNVVAYTDGFDYVVYIDEAAATYDYAYLLTAKANKDSYGGKDSANVRLVLTDGTMLKVTTDNAVSDLIAAEGDGTYDDNVKNMIVSYSSNKSGIYTLSQKDKNNAEGDKKATVTGTNGAVSVAPGVEIFKNGRATIKTGSGSPEFTANSNTIVIVADKDTDPDKYSFTVFTGVKNIPDISSKASGTKIDVAANGDGVAKVVYVEEADVSGVGSVIYIRAASDAKFVKQTGDSSYYEVNAVVDGKLETLNVKADTEAAKILTGTGSGAGTFVGGNGSLKKVEVKAGVQYIVAAKSLTYNSDNLVTGVKFFDTYSATNGDGVMDGTGTKAAKQEVVGLGGASYAWADDVTVVRYNVKSGNFSISTIGSIKDDSNDGVLFVRDDGTLTGVCVIENEGGEGSSSTTTPEPGGPAAGELPGAAMNAGTLEIPYYKAEPSKEKIMEAATKIAEVEATNANKATGKVTFEDGTQMDFTLVEYVAVKIGDTIIGYAKKGVNTDVANDSLTLNDTYLLKSKVAASAADYTVDSTDKAFKGVNINADIELVKAYKVTLSGSVTAKAGTTNVNNNDLVQEGQTLVVTGNLNTAKQFSQLTATVGTTVNKLGDVYTVPANQTKNSAEYLVNSAVTLGEDEVFSVKVGDADAAYYKNGAAIEVAAGQSYAANLADGTKSVAGTDLINGTTADGKTTWTLNSAKKDSDNKIVLTPVTVVTFTATGVTVKDAANQAITTGAGVVESIKISVTAAGATDTKYILATVDGTAQAVGNVLDGTEVTDRVFTVAATAKTIEISIGDAPAAP